MAKWLQLWNAWEVQLLVLASFILQVFLHITGRRRRRSMNTFLRLCIWMAYLAADSVAVYVLGILSRQVDGGASEGRGAPHPLAFIWAPFLLIHLGGQDNITAFAIEDNNLWLRHLLNLVLQAVLALYVFWKSMGTAWRDDVRLLAPGVLVFLAGLIKYGERTMALKYGKLISIEGSVVNDEDRTPDLNVSFSCNPAVPCCHRRQDIVSGALNSVPGVRYIFAGYTTYQLKLRKRPYKSYHQKSCTGLAFKIMEIELAIMYDDLYTKAAVLRTRTGIVARCVSQVSTGVALVLFLVSSKQNYNIVDVAMTYLLFVGCLSLEVLSTPMIIISPWTWDWFKARKCSWLASTSWWLLSSKVGWPEERPLWSNYMGQYNFLSYLGEYEYGHHSGLWKQKLMMLVRQTVNFAGVGKGYLFPICKLLDTRFEKVEEDIKVSIAKLVQDYYSKESNQRQFTKLALLLPIIEQAFAVDFGSGIIMLHVYMEVHFGNASPKDTTEAAVRVVCRKLSNYMMYLLVRKPEMLPVVSGTTEANLKDFCDQFTVKSGSKVLDGDFWCRAKEVWRSPELPRCKETAEEMKELWLRILLYAAGKSRPEINAAQLREGGELLTFAWLLMAHKGLGDSGYVRIELKASGRQQGDGVYFIFDNSQRSSAAQSPV